MIHVYLPMVTKVDIFGLGSAPYDEVEFARRRRGEGGQVSDKHWRDVGEVLRVRGPDIKRAYLDLWAGRLGVDALLARAGADAERYE